MAKKEGILLIGADGMLGSQVAEQLKQKNQTFYQSVLKPEHEQHLALDITNKQQVLDLIDQIKPECIINCSAYTDVDGAEKNEELATLINGTGAENLSLACNMSDSHLIHISTDYVFDGQATIAYQPEDPVAPQSAYGRSKLIGEEKIQDIAKSWTIIRTAWLYGPDGNHFIKTILNLARKNDQLKIVNDQKGCPTYTVELAKCIIDFSANKTKGMFHFCNSPECSWYDFALEAINMSNIKCEVNPCTTEEFPRPAPRPSFSVLNCDKTDKHLSWARSSWQDTLKHYLNNYEYEIAK